MGSGGFPPSVRNAGLAQSGLVGLGGFSAINVPYKNAASNETIMIVGGYNERLGTSLIFVIL